jgi:hypothetical protein
MLVGNTLKKFVISKFVIKRVDCIASHTKQSNKIHLVCHEKKKSKDRKISKNMINDLSYDKLELFI